MQSLMGETTAVAHGGDPQDRTASPRPRCIATPYSQIRCSQIRCSLWYINLSYFPWI
ncbi:hypothetical protein [Moorena producens]|uniref:hypothetical protein n=1 Tax=Moorena producens TaxID=1155739 RepID=UPI000A9E3A82|nr:hypothetical protein [Moorena producens]